MAVTEKVRETATELKEDVRDTVAHLRDEVAQLRDKVGQMVPFRRKASNVPVRQQPDALAGSPSWPSLFDDPWFDMGWPSPRLARLLSQLDQEFAGEWPQVDVTEAEREIRVRAELPGVEDGDIDVSVSGRMLTIQGEKRSESEDRGKDHYRHECSYGSFHRSIPLPCDVERDEVEARFRKGVLTVTLPKTSEARSSLRRIPVRTS